MKFIPELLKMKYLIRRIDTYGFNVNLRYVDAGGVAKKMLHSFEMQHCKGFECYRRNLINLFSQALNYVVFSNNVISTTVIFTQNRTIFF